MSTVTITGGRFQDPITFVSEVAYEADKKIRNAELRIGSIQYDLKKERNRLTVSSYAEYIEETKSIILGLELELVEDGTRKCNCGFFCSRWCPLVRGGTTPLCLTE